MIDTGLKEWAAVCELLLEGRLAFLLRKGGIAESGGPGVFELTHRRFALFPSWAHQKPEMIQRRYRDRVVAHEQEPAEFELRGWGEATEIQPVPSREAIDALEEVHVWSPAQVDMRFEYKPERPLYVVLVRAYLLSRPKRVLNHAAYTGCRSWVPLRPGDELSDSDLESSSPVLEDASYRALCSRVLSALS